MQSLKGSFCLGGVYDSWDAWEGLWEKPTVCPVPFLKRFNNPPDLPINYFNLHLNYLYYSFSYQLIGFFL